jgi:hypothetical protein
MSFDVKTGPGTNTGHGHVWARPDGRKENCGGAGYCNYCAGDLWRLRGSFLSSEAQSISPAEGRAGNPATDDQP